METVGWGWGLTGEGVIYGLCYMYITKLKLFSFLFTSLIITSILAPWEPTLIWKLNFSFLDEKLRIYPL